MSSLAHVGSRIRAGKSQLLFSCFLIAAAAFSTIPTSAQPAALAAATTMSFTSLMGNCWESWTRIPFTGNVEISFTSSGPVDVYILTNWEGQGEQAFESSVCFLNHPTSSSQNCGIPNTSPNCIFARAQVTTGSYNVNLPSAFISDYDIVFTECCSNSLAESTVNVSIQYPSAGLTATSQSSQWSFNPAQYMSTYNQASTSVSSLNMTQYYARTNSVNSTADNSALPNPLTQLTQLLKSIFANPLNLGISVGLQLAMAIPIIKRLNGRKTSKKSETGPKKCTDCGKVFPPSPVVNWLVWDYCRICGRLVCLYCLESLHNEKCAFRRFYRRAKQRKENKNDTPQSIT